MSFPRYPEYREAGVPWLGSVPSHWSVDRLKQSVAICKNGIWGNDPQGDENDIACVRVADFDRAKLVAAPHNPTIRNVEPTELRFRCLRPGDLLLEKSGGGEKQPVGCVVLYEGQHGATCANFIARIKLASDMSPSFWRYVHSALYSANLNKRSIKQTSGIQNIDQQAYLDERVAFPPPEEQRHIADFLEHETARIDALIGEQKRLIELLSEKRKAIISHAIQDHGKGPETKLGHYAETLQGYAFPSSGFVDEPGLRLLRGVNIGVGELRWDDTVYWPDKVSNGLHRYALQPDDIVFGMDRPWINGGTRVAWVSSEDLPALLLQRVARIRPRPGLVRRFLFLILSSTEFRESIETDLTGVSVPHISPDQIANFRTRLPPHTRQTEICDTVDREMGQIDATMSEAANLIEQLQERRSALISATVTGKIDVRGSIKTSTEASTDARSSQATEPSA